MADITETMKRQGDESWTEATVRSLNSRTEELRRDWGAARPFRWIVCDDFLPESFATAIRASYPGPHEGNWFEANYVHSRKKLSASTGFPPVIAEYFALTAREEFRRWVTDVTGVRDLLADPELVGGGLHQNPTGAYLDVHVDYNFHPKTKLHRRLNLIVYLNDGWRPEWGGQLELWDMANKRRIAELEPRLNRAVLFETNEVSFHGHPTPLRCPEGETRKSMAMYYYTEKRDDGVVADEHNTLYRQTSGLDGYAKTARSAVAVTAQRIHERGVVSTASEIASKVARKLRGAPPENR